MQKVKAFTDNMPFDLTVDKHLIYYVFYKPGFSSSTCFNSITMDRVWTVENKITFRLGYPGTLHGETIEDLRNHPKLAATLKKKGQLK